jgi:alpha-L-rhamnosidase
MSPGQDIFLSTYAAQWVSACVHYWEITGDKSVLSDLGPAAERNIGAFEASRRKGGVPNSLAWGFVDWGYVVNSGPSDIAVNLHYLAALRDMVRWRVALADSTGAQHYRAISVEVGSIIQGYLQTELAKGGDAWRRIGFQRSALALKLGLIPNDQQGKCISAMKAHIQSCFPNNLRAPRLADPSVGSTQLITPYFAHFALAALAEHGEMEFVLEQYRSCWGWMLKGGYTTWLEVFDPRWSHCHEWSSCPTWQLSRYVLGLQPRFDLGLRHYVLKIRAGSLTSAAGSLPIPGRADSIHVRWIREGKQVHIDVSTPTAIVLHLGGERGSLVQVADRFSGLLPLEPLAK